TPCRFRTAYDVTLLPMSIEAVHLRTETPPSLHIKFKLADGVQLPKIAPSSIRLHFAGDASASRSLYLCLRRYLTRVSVVGPGGKPVPLAKASVHPVGFAPEDLLLPFPGNSYTGFRLLQEYFAFPSKYMFVDVAGLDGLATLGAVTAFELVFDLARLPEAMPPVSGANVLLHCTPIVNLFAHEGDPVRLDQTRTEYKVRPSGDNSFHYEIFTIDKISGVVKGVGKSREYRPLFRFARPPGGDTLFYRSRLQPSVTDDGNDTFLTPLPADASGAMPEIEVLSLELTCTNRQLPTKLKVGDVSVPTSQSPTFARFKNVTRPTSAVPPPLGSDLHWRLLSHLALNYLSLIDLDTLKVLLGLYNFRARVDRQAENAQRLLLEGIKRIAAKPATRLVEGHPVRGLSVEVDFDEDNFGGEGEAYLFGAILDEFFSQYVSLNAFIRLTVKGLKYGEIHSWPTRTGDRIIL
ncbi:MAG TPA: type VI secretion system baseplate subunit TssF, partial [Planctomycetota bacterium]|nr:type VI secretion system baseplate subunit TssF [Planctomycetota bacterium]